MLSLEENPNMGLRGGAKEGLKFSWTEVLGLETAREEDCWSEFHSFCVNDWYTLPFFSFFFSKNKSENNNINENSRIFKL